VRNQRKVLPPSNPPARDRDDTPPPPPPEDHDRCPDIEFLNLHTAIDLLDGWGVEVTGLDGWTAVGIFRRVTERGDELDVSPLWSKDDIYLIEIVDTLTDELITRTDIRNLRKVKCL